MHCFDPLYVKRNKNDKTTVTTTSLRDQNLVRYQNPPQFQKRNQMLHLKKHHLQSEIQGCMKITLNSITIS